MIVTVPLRKIALACIALGSFASLPAETILQTSNIPLPSDWNVAGGWGNNPLVVENDYKTNPAANANYPSGNPGGTDFTVDVAGVSTQWKYWNQMRDLGTTTTQTGDLAFNGGRLIVSSDTRFISKNRGFTTTANWVMEDRGYMFLSPTNITAEGTSKWAGTISTSGNTLIGLETLSARPTNLNVMASISGSGLLTLAGKGGDAATMSLTGNLDLFTGTFLLTVTAGKTANPLTFSIESSATLATLQLNYQSSATLFRYDLKDVNASFGSLVLGAGETAQVLGAGTYDATFLNSVTGDTGIFTGNGTITVVPEPSTVALIALGLFGTLAAARRKPRLS